MSFIEFVIDLTDSATISRFIQFLNSNNCIKFDDTFFIPLGKSFTSAWKL